MKRIIYAFLMGLLCMATAIGQPTNNLVLNLPESGLQVHQATNSITFNPGYSYSTAGGTMIAEIINSSINTPVTYNSFIDPASRNLITTPPYLVGTSVGRFDINTVGGASYRIPIDLPKGANGLVPSLSLVYSSNSGSGIAGYGWQIGGISVIGRTGQTIYSDGKTTGLNLSGEDRFILDGQRLVLTSGSYGADLATYQTEIDDFSRIQSQLASGSGPAKFMVQTKSGLKLNYGTYEDACQKITGISETINWYISEMSDMYGNMVSYKYMRNNNMIYPSEINYGPNKITFYYKERTDKTVTYLKGQKIEQQMLLDRIIIAYNSNVLKTYELKYNLITDLYNSYSVLNEVLEYGIGSSQLNSIVFSYQTPSNVIISNTANKTNSIVSSNSLLYPGDFNGDGKADFLCLPKGGTWTGMKICYSDGADNFSTVLSLSNTINLATLEDLQVIDINGDGKDDIVYESAEDNIVSYFYMINNESSLWPLQSFYSLWYDSNVGMNGKEVRRNSQVYDNQASNSDFNGDGINDIFISEKDGSFRIYSFANSSGIKTSEINLLYSEMGDPENIYTVRQAIQTGDFNGDGISDIWDFSGGNIGIYSFTGNAFNLLLFDTQSSNDYFTLGDFNGDGKTDYFIYAYKNSSGQEVDYDNWTVKLSTGTGFETKLIPRMRPLINGKLMVCDFNGDGSSDLMSSIPESGSTNSICYFINKNKGNDFYLDILSDYQSNSNYVPYLADFNGDERTDIVYSNYSPGYLMYKSTGNTVPLLEKVSDGLNNLTTISYTRLSQAPGSVYGQGTSPVYPVRNLQQGLTVVSSVTVSNGLAGGTNTISYYYEGAKIHLQGKGFLGYSKTAATNAATGMVTETQTGYNTTYFYPEVNSIIEKTTGGSNYATTTNTWSVKVLDAATKRIFPHVSSSIRTNNQTGHSITTNILSQFYDNYGNPGKIEKIYDGVTETTTASFTNTISNDTWNLGRVDNSTITYTKAEENPVSHAVRYTYHTDGIMKPDYVYYNEGTSLEYYENFDYDSKGNVTQIYTSGASIGANQVNTTYDTDGINTLTISDILGHTTTNTYDSYGRLSTQKDYMNNIITYGYDGLSRQSSISSSLGNQTTTTYLWTGANKPANAVSGISRTGNDGSIAITWVDKLGRTVRTEKKGFNGTMILTDIEYNAKGQVERVSDPYFAGSSVTWAETYALYDDLGRVKTVNRNTGRNTTFNYSANRVTETTTGKNNSTWKEYDSKGLVTKAHDDGGDISYTYFPDGKVKSITSPGGAVTNMEYNDAARNQTKISDPSTGITTYTYDSFSRVKTQTDARSNLTSLTYYPDGRINTKVNPEGTTTYIYNPNKQLTDINSPNSVSRTYGYDTQGRVNSITENIAGNTFSTTFTFDAIGRLWTKTHPSGIVETLGYNSYGYMETISAGGAIRYTITGMNAREQLTAATYGSSLNASYGYDAFGYPSSTTTGTVQNYGYVFNPVTGNLSSRQNALRSLSESFAYDTDGMGLDRLASVTGPQNLTMTYADNGNLSTKSDIDATVGFSYGLNAGPYSLTGVTSSTNVIPTNAQTITYNSFEKVATISEANGGQTINTSFTYNSDNQRAKMTVGGNYGAEILTRYYVGGSYMKEVQPTTSNEYTYLGGDAYTAPVVVHNAQGETSYYYLLRDHLGNITHQVNTSNAVVAEYSFDAWGRRRNAANWSYTLDGNDKALFADRGFTGHEYLPWYNLYNMNGRLYDPAVGRFLSADPVVQDPGNSQSYNRYSYCLNNPLKYTDPSGYILEQQDLPPDPEQSAGGAEFYRKFSGSNSGNGWINGWYTAYRQALNKGYTGDLVKFMDIYDNRVFSPNFNGNLNFTYYTTSSRNCDEPGCLPSVSIVRTRHDIIINISGQDVYDWGRTGNALGLGGIAYGALENAIANNYWWMDAKGNYNSTKILLKGANGKFIQGIQGYRNGYNSALNAASKFKITGNIVGALGLGVTVVQWRTNQITGLEATVDGVFGVISFIGPIGAGIGATYFIGKLGYEYFSGNTVFEKPQ